MGSLALFRSVPIPGLEERESGGEQFRSLTGYMSVLPTPLPAGVQFDIDLPNKKVCINSEHSVDTLLETLGKTGKAVSYLGPK